MAVDFPSDLILDVARAADPQRARNVETRLAGAAGGTDASSILSEASKIGRHLSRVHQGKDAHEAAKEFEALLVANMITDMMGEEGESFFGGGRIAVIDDFRRVTTCYRGKTQLTKLKGQDKGHQQEVTAFAEAVKQGGTAPISWEELQAVSAASILAVQSLREGTPLPLQ